MLWFPFRVCCHCCHKMFWFDSSSFVSSAAFQRVGCAVSSFVSAMQLQPRWCTAGARRCVSVMCCPCQRRGGGARSSKGVCASTEPSLLLLLPAGAPALPKPAAAGLKGPPQQQGRDRGMKLRAGRTVVGAARQAGVCALGRRVGEAVVQLDSGRIRYLVLCDTSAL